MLNVVGQHHCLKDHLFIHDGDLETITKEIMEKYFGGELGTLHPGVSCAYKHLLAYTELIHSKGSEYALILEDDIFLYKNFCFKLKKIIDEIEQRKLQNFIISLEDSHLKYVKGSERKKDKLLYKKLRVRMTGAYLIDKQSARKMLKEVEDNKCNLPIDWFQNHCSDKQLLDVYWAHPTIAVQGSLNGKMNSLIDHKSSSTYKKLKFKISRLYKMFLYRIR